MLAAQPIFDKLDLSRALAPRLSTVRFMCAKDGVEIISICRAQSVDLVLLPATFGQVTGSAIARSLQTLDTPPRTLLFVDSPEQGKALVKDTSTSDVVVGPIEPQELLARCARLLGVPLREDVSILVRLRVETGSASTHMVLGTIVDISVSGMLVETTSTTVAVGDVLSAEFFLPGQPGQVAMMAKVARVDENAPNLRRIGIAFLRSQDETVARIKHFIQSRTR